MYVQIYFILYRKEHVQFQTIRKPHVGKGKTCFPRTNLYKINFHLV